MLFLYYIFNSLIICSVIVLTTASLSEGMVAAVAISAGMELFIIISAFVFLFEALSVIIQVGVYKKTKKRVFKMAPVHHHFEMCGWKETKIVAIFSIVTLLLCTLCYVGL